MSSPKNPTEKPGFFDKKRNVRLVIFFTFLGCVLTIIGDVWLHLAHLKHPHFKWEEWPGFYAAFGFVSCILLVLTAKILLRPFVKRAEDFYDR